VLDFAGGIVIHTSAGAASIVTALMLGPRAEFAAGDTAALTPHNLPMAAIGAGLLWFGWFSFNGGSSLASGALASSTLMTTHTAGSYAGLRLEPEISRGRRAAYLVLSRLRPPCRHSAGGAVWVLLDWAHTGRPTFVGVINGGIAGLAGVTPASGFVSVGAGGVIVC
jgi:Amt family ammonium transporter